MQAIVAKQTREEVRHEVKTRSFRISSFLGTFDDVQGGQKKSFRQTPASAQWPDRAESFLDRSVPLKNNLKWTGRLPRDRPK
ncbi:hypothetical protein L596_017558 [Steinernema carpocapsae]|uniref:Uncharacterized protein n=1 Tax=Steinernema carpocapsae TaxID=34508 RepID=A0A4U5N2B5_STECR|nr:hypothetical protein L596_017558 [Steinernema carpocapsae]